MTNCLGDFLVPFAVPPGKEQPGLFYKGFEVGPLNLILPEKDSLQRGHFPKRDDNKTKQDPVGILGMEAFETVANQGREGMQRQRRSSQGTTVQP